MKFLFSYIFMSMIVIGSCTQQSFQKEKEAPFDSTFASKWQRDSLGCSGFRKDNVGRLYLIIDYWSNNKTVEMLSLLGDPNSIDTTIYEIVEGDTVNCIRHMYMTWSVCNDSYITEILDEFVIRSNMDHRFIDMYSVLY